MTDNKRFITLQDGDYTIMQKYAFSDIYQILIIKDDKILFSVLADYRTEDQLLGYLKNYLKGV